VRVCAAFMRACADAVRLQHSRFIALSRDPLPTSSLPAGVPYKTSIVFSLAEGAPVSLRAPSSLLSAALPGRRPRHALQGALMFRAARHRPLQDREVRPPLLAPRDSAHPHTRSHPAHSRPMRTSPITVVDPAAGEQAGGPQVLRFSYLFYADLLASTSDVNTQNALRHLQEMAPFLRVLGCYQQDCSGRFAPGGAKGSPA